MNASTGVVILLFTDLVGSTAVLERLGDDAAEELRRIHFSLLRGAIAEAGGREVKTLGDGVMAAFTSPVQALAAAVAIQRAIADHNRGHPDQQLRVRVGLHAGEAVSEEDDFFGTPVVIAKRLCDRAKGGQILITAVLAGLAGNRGGYRFRPAGTLELKGLAEPVAAMAVEWEPAGAESVVRPLRRSGPPEPRGPELVGRDEELAELEAELERARDGEFRVVLVLGDPGVGKTRLVSELLARRREDCVCLSARAYPLGATASFGVWGEALERHLRGLPDAEVSDLCGGFLDDLAGLVRTVAAIRGAIPDREPARMRLVQAVATVLANLARRQPVAVFLDDMHLADASSWEALDYLAHNLADVPVLVVVAARPVELADQQLAGPVLLGLDQEGFLSRLALHPLDSGGLARLAGAVLHQEPPVALVDWLTRRSRGNPLFALSLLRALAEEGADLSAPGLRNVPEELAERVVARVRQLDEPVLQVLELLVVLGRPVEAGELARLSGRSAEELGSVIERLLPSRLVVEEVRERLLGYELAHPLIQEAVYESMSGLRRRALHRQLGRALRATGRLGEAAPHFARSASEGDSEAIEALGEAVRQAEGREAYREALAILGDLVELLPPGDERWLHIADALSPHAEWVYRGDPGQAALGIRAMEALDAVLSSVPDPARRAAVKFRLANFLGWGTGQLDEAEQSCIEAAALYQEAGDIPMKMLADCELAWIRGIRGDLAALQEGAAAVAEAALRAGYPFVARQALGAEGYAALHRGRFSAAESAIRRAITIDQESGERGSSILLWTLSACLVCEGRLGEARQLLEVGRSKEPAQSAEWARRELFPDWHAGNFRAALTRAREIVASSGGEQTRRSVGELVFACFAALELDERDEATKLLARGRLALGGGEWLLFTDYWAWAEALLAEREGRRSETLSRLAEVVSKLMAKDGLASAAFVLADLVEIAAEAGEVQSVGEAAEQVASIAMTIDRDLYSALAAYTAAWSSLTAGDPGAAAGHARRAIELFADLGYRPLLGRSRYVLGRSLLRSDPAAAAGVLEEAAAVFEACGAVWRRQAALDALRPDYKVAN